MSNRPFKHLVALGTLSCALGAWAAPFTPSSDAQVVERLPRALMDSQSREAERRQRQLRADTSPVNRIALARQQFDLAMSQGDPRYAGYAQGTLAGLDAQAKANPSSVPGEYWLVKGMLQQYLHAFDDALVSLGRAQTDPETQAESLAWQAAIHMVVANYEAARRACEALRPHSTEIYVTGCLAYVDATTGRTREAYATLDRALTKAADAAPAHRLWLHTRLAEMALRLGQLRQAESHFHSAMKLGVTDQFLLGAYADFLIDAKRPAEAIALLQTWERSDVLLLRLALAGAATGDPRGKQWATALAERFAAAEQRGDGLHELEAARFELDLRQRAERSLALASRNYASQREPRDAEMLMRAALAAHQPAAARAALEWLQRSGFEDPRLHQLASQLAALAAAQPAAASAARAGGKP